MIARTTTQSLLVYAPFDIPRVRAALRVRLVDAQYSVMFIGRTVTIFTGLADVLFTANGDQQVEITMECQDDDQRLLVLQGAIPGAASKLRLLNDSTDTLRRIADDFQIMPDNGYLRVKVVLAER